MQGFVRVGDTHIVKRALDNFEALKKIVDDELVKIVSDQEEAFKPSFLEKLRGVRTLRDRYHRADTYLPYVEWCFYNVDTPLSLYLLILDLDIFEEYPDRVSPIDLYKSLKALYETGGEMHIDEDLAKFVNTYKDYHYVEGE